MGLGQEIWWLVCRVSGGVSNLGARVEDLEVEASFLRALGCGPAIEGLNCSFQGLGFRG